MRMSTLQVGDSIGRFRIQAIIGEGALGTIYRAWDPNRRRLVAIKELSAELKARNPTRYAEYLERFRMERRIQSQLVHLRIVAAYEPMKQGETEYLITEYLDGGTLADLIKQEGSIPPERVIEIGIEMCQAIAAAWERDIVHCDINPGNILLTSDGRAKLAGFGTAQVGKMSHRSQTYRRHPGTPTYMSPEQEEGRSYLDERSDLYSLGLVLYEALTGKPYKHERVPVRRLTSKVPAGAEKAVMRALEHEVGARYQSAAAFETALRQALDRRRPTWPWRVVGVGALVGLVAGGVLIAQLVTARRTGTPEPTAMQTRVAVETPSPSPTATALPTQATIAATTIPSPSLLPTARPTATEVPVSTVPATRLPLPTPLPAISAPTLSEPPGAASVKSPDITLRWIGQLPNNDYGFRVTLYHKDGAQAYGSPILGNEAWTVHLPGSEPAIEAIGEWRWSVTVVQRAAPGLALARSDEWTFYFNPFAGP